MAEKDLAWQLADAIRRVLIREHYEDCRCAERLVNECGRRRLDEAFKLYCRVHPEHFEVF